MSLQLEQIKIESKINAARDKEIERRKKILKEHQEQLQSNKIL